MPSNIGLIVGKPTNGRLVQPQWSHALQVQSYPTNTSIGHFLMCNQEVGEARDRLVEESLKVNADFLWFVDDDTEPPYYAISMLMYELKQKPEFDVIGGIYCTKNFPPAPIVYRGNGHGEFWDWTAGDVFEVTGIGTGCMLIRMSIFKTLSPPWFVTSLTTREPNEEQIVEEGYTDDLYFCDKARAAGHRILAHGGVLCQHWDMEQKAAFILPPDSLPYKNYEAGKRTAPMELVESATP
jgi:hypothetical protein